MSNLTKTLAVVSLLAPMSAQPLGIGDIQLHSALNQRLNAEIRLNLAAGENPADISVRLAPPEKFDKAGVPWNYFLSKIKFEPVVQSNGAVIIKVTSREPLTEPFLDFLLEVNWPQGSQIREFTVLIDPPAEYGAPVMPTLAASPYQVEALDEYQPPVRKPRAAKKRSVRTETASNITPQTPTSGEYGPTRTADTLWRIAERLGSERNVPTNQMMRALYQANPDAFVGNNIDSLKKGVVLKIPETDAILQSGGPRGKQTPPAPKAVAPSPKALELVAPTEAKITDTHEPVKPGQESGEPGDVSSTGGGTSPTGQDVELQTRIDRLEQQLNMMQQLLALKDQQLAALQSNDKQAAQQAADSAQNLTRPTPTQTPEPQTTPATQPQTTAEPAVQPPAVVATQPPTVQPTPPAPVKPKPKPAKPITPAPVEAEEGLFSSPLYNLAMGGMGAGILGLLGWLLWRKRNIENQTNTESMFASASQIKMPDSDSSLSVPVMDMSSTGAYDVGTVGESSFISDFTPSDFEAFDTDQSEVDPLSEADVYLAYGRYQQAEDLIRHAIKDQPEKDEYKLKLLEIFYANENKDRFAEYAQELADAGKNTDRPFWTKVTDMGKELIPESVLFGGTTKDFSHDHSAPQTSDSHASAKAAPTSEQAHFDSVDDLDFGQESSHDDLADLNTLSLPDMALMDDINSELAELQLTGPEETPADDNSLDFDLSAFSGKADTEQATIREAAPDIESIDFDLSSLAQTAPKPADTAEEKAADTLEGFDFNFDLESTEPSSEDGTPLADTKASLEEPLDMASLESFDFPEFESLSTKDKPDQVGPATNNNAIDTPDEFDFNFDFNAPSSLSIDDDVDLGVADLTDMDEFETKIDLAKAYIDMGDAAAAKAIAEEVLKKGTAEQQQAAQALLDELK
ncbi:fimbrial protein FimV [Methylomonas sp. LL1]|uniref:FimV/HubP family polar landmark protein n=1 Tax=Methylomonas sp. LL1 TaxID=2785785 RepID=UPI0018C420E6|nr:FimV/HubP family polar landmark protein [Methylomonas sp. LL1]QPK62180.1 fimbrial protein FimV [Methylomonas sp. LL1]